MPPLFSIISPIYNCQAKLNRTLASVLSQNFTDFEYLFIDGNSNDGTLKLLASIGDSRVRFTSEPDQGVYDAMNKGIRQSRGRYLYFLGVGDELLPGVLQRISELLPSHEMAFLYGNAIVNGQTFHYGQLSKIDICHNNISHQAIFFGRDVFNIIGDYDQKYRTWADWAFNLRCFGDSRITIEYLPVTVAIYEGGGISEARDRVFHAEKGALIRKNLGLKTYFRFQKDRWVYHLKRIFHLKTLKVGLLRSFRNSAK